MNAEDEEQWKSIDSDDGYEISSLGRVRKVVAGSYRPDGYKCFNITKDGCNRRMTGHRLVAQYFLNDGVELGRDDLVDHLNGLRGDNRLCNLRVVNHKTNMENLEPVRAAIKADLLKELKLQYPEVCLDKL